MSIINIVKADPNRAAVATFEPQRGQCFLYGATVVMVTDDSQAVDLQDGEIMDFDFDDELKGALTRENLISNVEITIS